eukprot:TRINITY_DN1106_c0_g1_i1.p3 TRINITY_DN1106_c0_g1~~TRINITY_DN1106_c0_g1_i1.p3  ORF type:complete len:100 (-),score=28.34 TRINITY_DN1106_c0_g1_i1:135-434(-)
MEGFRQNQAVKYLYDITLLYPFADPAQVPSIYPIICGAGKYKVTAYVRKFEISKLPQDDAGLDKFMIKLYQEKDQLYQAFVAGGYKLPAAYATSSKKGQ